MEYTFETLYNQEALTIMAKCLRKTVRRKKSKRSHFFGWIVVILAVILSVASDAESFAIDFKKVITWTVALAIVVSFIFEDWLNGYFAKKRMLKGTEKSTSTFDTEIATAFISETAIGKSEFSYDKVAQIAETERYFVFIFSENHAQVYDKVGISGGTVDEFREFISKVTNKTVVFVS
jgi:cation transport ATPase